MRRRFILGLCAAVALTAVTGSGIPVAAEDIPAPGTITTVAGTGQPGFSGDNGPAAQARVDFPKGIAIDGAGNVFFADGVNARIRKVSPAGIITTVAGTGVLGHSGDEGLATQAQLGYPFWLALDGAGNLFFSQWANHRVRKIDANGIITTVAGSGPITFEALGDYAGDGGPATEARLYYPRGLAVDAAGNLFIADTGNHRIRKVSPDGTITTVAGSGPTGPDMGYASGDGGPALQARMRGPHGLAVDASGNLFLTEQDPQGSGTYTGPRFQIRKISPDGIIRSVASNGLKGYSGDGGPALGASLDNPYGLAVDSAGNIFIADTNNYRVRKVDTNGIITTVAGTGLNPYAGDSVQATTTGLRGPVGVAVDAAGNLLLSDSAHVGHEADGLGYNERVLMVFGAAAPGLLAGMPFPKRP